ncbi:MAG: HEAT repeat domain-containing protein [Chloroflexi bacterium]|nr:HEAT repeat domain-containing protein [Chloroflexota bacterium]
MNFDLPIDPISFWVGFAAGMLLMLFFQQVRPILRQTRQALGEQVETVKAGLSTSIETRYRQDVLKFMQANHLAAPLFSLDELSLPAALLAPPAPVVPEGEIPIEDIVALTLPYLPDWPEVGAVYGAAKMSLAEALSGGGDLLLVGRAGSGKTVALSRLALRTARRDPELGEELAARVPVYVHAAELVLPPKDHDKPLDVFYNALAEKVSTLVEAQLPQFLEAVFSGGLALLIVDGLDELPPTGHSGLIEFLADVKTRYPGVRLVAAAAPEDISAMEPLGLHPVAMAAWDRELAARFLERWAALWQEHVLNEPWAAALPPLPEPMVLNGWLLDSDDLASPLALTLKAWATYAGDTRGPRLADALDAYVRRMTAGIHNARPAMEQLAAQMTLTLNPNIARNAAGRFVSSFEDPTAPSDLPAEAPAEIEGLAEFADELDALLETSSFEDEIEEIKEGSAVAETTGAAAFKVDPFLGADLDALAEDTRPEKARRGKGRKADDVSGRSVRRMLPELVKSMILAYRPGSRISFSHPVVAGYLAGRGLASRGGAAPLLPQPPWTGRSLALEFVAAAGDVGALMNAMLDDEDPLMRRTLIAARWPRHAGTAAWRANLLRALAGLLQREDLSIGLRLRLSTALAYSGEKSIGALFRQMLSANSISVRFLGILGCGLSRSAKAVPELAQLLYDPSPQVSRAAALALVAIGDNPSLEAVTSALLQGDETLRKSAAEALANDPDEGFAVLKDGATVDDLAVRRAVVFGLARLRSQAWARELLETIQVEDSQWVVRNAAQQGLEAIGQFSLRVPRPQPPLHETGWLIKFASDQGMGVTEKTAWETAGLALRQGSEEQRLAAMDLLRQRPSAARNLLRDLYGILYGPEGEMRESAFWTLWQVGAAGVDLPSPEQLGV